MGPTTFVSTGLPGTGEGGAGTSGGNVAPRDRARPAPTLNTLVPMLDASRRPMVKLECLISNSPLRHDYFSQPVRDSHDMLKT